MGTQKKRKWTVFFIIKPVLDSFPEVVYMLNEIRSLDISEDIVLLFLLRINKNQIDVVKQGDPYIIPQSAEAYLTNFFLKVVPDTDKSARFKNTFDEIQSNDPTIDITRAEDVAKFFNLSNREEYRAERYMLFTWDHGKSYGIFPKQIFLLKKGIRNISLSDSEGGSKFSEEILTIQELNEAIQLGFEGGCIEMVIMMNCSMQFFDAGYALRNSVRYMIASETSIYDTGYNYPFIFQVLSDNPRITSKKLAKCVISSFSTKYYPNITDNDHKNHTAIFAVNLFFYDRLKSLIELLVAHLRSILPNAKLDILLAKRNSLVDKNLVLIDFYSFVKNLEAYNLFSTNPTLVSVLLSTKEMAIVKSFVGNELTKSNNVTRCLPLGFSIYFPPILGLDGNDPSNGFHQTEFFRTSSWRDLLLSCQEI